jgi:predicted nucleotidyltransferase
MKILGIVAEYNPFHKGHLYHLKKAQEIVKPDLTIIVMSPQFVQRGEPAIISKWIRSRIAIESGADIVIELPTIYAVESADYFAKGAMTLLHEMGITDLLFGSENGDIEQFIEIANTIENHQEQYNTAIKEAMDQGLRYPDACNRALSLLLNKEVKTPNDLLGLSYVKEIIHNHYDIRMHCIKRTNDYHEEKLQEIASATSLRKALHAHIDVSSQLPGYQYYKDEHLYSFSEFFPYLKYAILFNEQLSSIHLVDEGIENLLKDTIKKTDNMEDLINRLTSKRYTRSRIQRMLVHILLNNKKEDVPAMMQIDYIRLLAFSKTGQLYIRKQKKRTDFKIIANISKHQHPSLTLEYKAATLLSLIYGDAHTEISSIPYHE